MKRLLSLSGIAIAAALAISPAPALAHTAVTKTSIANNAHLGAAPTDFTVTLEHEAALAVIKLTDAGGKGIALAYTPTRDRSKAFTIPLPQLADGSYKLAWKTIAADGHVMESSVSFMIMKR